MGSCLLVASGVSTLSRGNQKESEVVVGGKNSAGRTSLAGGSPLTRTVQQNNITLYALALRAYIDRVAQVRASLLYDNRPPTYKATVSSKCAHTTLCRLPTSDRINDRHNIEREQSQVFPFVGRFSPDSDRSSQRPYGVNRVRILPLPLPLPLPSLHRKYSGSICFIQEEMPISDLELLLLMVVKHCLGPAPATIFP